MLLSTKPTRPKIKLRWLHVSAIPTGANKPSISHVIFVHVRQGKFPWRCMNSCRNWVVHPTIHSVSSISILRSDFCPSPKRFSFRKDSIWAHLVPILMIHFGLCFATPKRKTSRFLQILGRHASSSGRLFGRTCAPRMPGCRRSWPRRGRLETRLPSGRFYLFFIFIFFKYHLKITTTLLFFLFWEAGGGCSRVWVKKSDRRFQSMFPFRALFWGYLYV